MSEDLTTIQAEKIVDARGTSCPGPILAAKKGIPGVSVGGVMEVQATDSGTRSGAARISAGTGSMKQPSASMAKLTSSRNVHCDVA